MLEITGFLWLFFLISATLANSNSTSTSRKIEEYYKDAAIFLGSQKSSPNFDEYYELADEPISQSRKLDPAHFSGDLVAQYHCVFWLVDAERDAERGSGIIFLLFFG
ncbi:unnamed protein product [Caenorhabditis angaria]|uniref:Uncharacterized protein n=1 Tax=Caenorhabditis angaria TaxID=860376 RepID=A0A9P1MYT8_9PELO|nr:unnamed protein product [Caenorhabditis angaria]